MSPVAFAQTASQITPPAFETQGSAESTPDTHLPTPVGAVARTPANAASLKVRPGRVEIEGGLPELAGETDALRARLSGRLITGAEIFAAARELEAAYGKAGFALVRVVLPAQSLTDGGTLRLQVVDGFIERIDTSALPERIGTRIEEVLAPLANRRGLRMPEIERRLLLAGDTPGTRLRSVLTKGKAAGGTVLVLEAKYRPVTGFATADNTLSSAIDHSAPSIGADANSPTGHGETVYVRGSNSPVLDGENGLFGAHPRNRLLVAGVTVPIGIDGMTLGLEATQARTAPRPRAGALTTVSDFQRLSARLRQPVIRTRVLNVNAEGVFEAENEAVDVIHPVEAGLSRDRVRVVRAGGDANWTNSAGTTIASRIAASFGLDAFGARHMPDDPDAVPVSRMGSEPDFRKAEISLAISQPLANHLLLDLKGRAQTSFGDPLPRAEQIELTGLTSLSGFDAGRIQGDEGYVLRAELQMPFVIALPSGKPDDASAGDSNALLLSPYLFAAYGEAHLKEVTALESTRISANSYGAGLRLAAECDSGFSGLSASLEYASAERLDGTGRDNRFTFTTYTRF